MVHGHDVRPPWPVIFLCPRFPDVSAAVPPLPSWGIYVVAKKISVRRANLAQRS
jgi:hypothetical protein